MRAKRRQMHGRRRRRSPLKKEYDFTKTTRDFSPEATKDTIGSKIAEAVTPKNIVDAIPLPVGKAVKAAKAIYNYFS
tara:strand:+ start:309 stop:539 length:231 start_codon:yes stop_codon:yes gene_type:complete